MEENENFVLEERMIPYRHHNLKPIFKEELDFLNKRLDNLVIKDSWRHGQSIFLNPYEEKPYLTFKVKDGEVLLGRLYEDRIKENISLNEIVEREREIVTIRNRIIG